MNESTNENTTGETVESTVESHAESKDAAGAGFDLDADADSDTAPALSPSLFADLYSTPLRPAVLLSPREERDKKSQIESGSYDQTANVDEALVLISNLKEERRLTHEASWRVILGDRLATFIAFAALFATASALICMVITVVAFFFPKNPRGLQWQDFWLPAMLSFGGACLLAIFGEKLVDKIQGSPSPLPRRYETFYASEMARREAEEAKAQDERPRMVTAANRRRL